MNARSFAAGTDQIQFTNADILVGATAVTIAFRMRVHEEFFTDFGANRAYFGIWGPAELSFLVYSNAGTSKYDFTVLQEHNGNWFEWRSTDQPLKTADGNNDTDWHTWVIQWAADGTVRVFKDGVLRATAVVSGSFSAMVSAPGTPLTFGRAGDGSQDAVKCDLSRVDFWAGLLDTPDIAQVSNDVKGSTVRPEMFALTVLLDGSDPERAIDASDATVYSSASITGTSVVVDAPPIPPALVATGAASVREGSGIQFTLSWYKDVVPDAPAEINVSGGPGTWTNNSVTLDNTVGATVVATLNTDLDTAGSYTIHFDPLDPAIGSAALPLEVTPVPATIDRAEINTDGGGKMLRVWLKNTATGQPTKVQSVSGDLTVTVGARTYTGRAARALVALSGGDTGSPEMPFLIVPLVEPWQRWIVDDTDAAVTSTGTWEPYLGPPDTRTGGVLWDTNGRSVGDSAQQSADPTATRTFPVAGLTPGQKVRVAWSIAPAPALSMPDRTTDASYTVRDGVGGPVLATFHANQADPAWSIADGRRDYAPLGTVTPTGATLEVVVANAAGAGLLVADAIRVEVFHDPVWQPGDPTPTITAPDGWATAEAGLVGPTIDLPVTLADDDTVMDLSSPVPPMRVGYNFNFPTPYTPDGILWADRGRAADLWGQHGPVTQDMLGNLFSLDATDPKDRIADLRFANGWTNGDDGRMAPSHAMSGTWRVKAKATPGSLSVVSSWFYGIPDFNTQENVIGDYVYLDSLIDLSGNVDNGIDLNVRATVAPVSEVQIFDPEQTAETGFDIDNPPVFHPRHRARMNALGPRAVHRFMDAWNTNGQDFVDFSDIPSPVGRGSFIHNAVRQEFGVLKVGPIDLNDPVESRYAFYSPFHAVVKVTYDGPAPFPDGGMINYGQCLEDGTDANQWPSNTGGNVYLGDVALYLDETRTTAIVHAYSTTAAGSGPNGDGPVTLAGEHIMKAGSIAFHERGNGWPLDYIIEHSNVTDSDPWINVTDCMTDDCLYQIGFHLGQKLSAGIVPWVEYENEVWHFQWGKTWRCLMKGLPDGIGMSGYYCEAMKRCQDKVQEGWAAAGRTDSITRVLGMHLGGTTDGRPQYCNDHGIPYDVAAGAPYPDNRPVHGGYSSQGYSLYNEFDRDQILDLWGYHVHGTGLEEDQARIRAIMDAHGGADKALACYELGLGRTFPGGADNDNWFARVHEVWNHPRMYRVMMGLLRECARGGCTTAVRYLYSGLNGLDNDQGWIDYRSALAEPGRGDGSDGKFDNRTNPYDYRRAVSPTAQALIDLAAAAEPVPATGYTLELIPPNVTVGQTATVRVKATPLGAIINGSVDLTASGPGTLAVNTLVFADESTKTTTLTATGEGTVEVSALNSANLTDPAPATLTVTATPVATTYTVETNATGTVGVAQPVNVTLDAAATATINLSATGGTLDTGTVGFTNEAGPKAVNFTPNAAGAATITGTNNAGLADPSPVVVNVGEPDPGTSVALDLTGPTVGPIGSPSTRFRVTATSLESPLTFTPSSTVVGDVFIPASVELTAEAPTATFRVQAVSAGSRTIAGSHTGTATGPDALTFTAHPIVISGDDVDRETSATSVTLAMPTGFTVSGSPVTGTGTLEVSTTLTGLIKGTGSGFTTAAAGTDYLAPGGDGSGLTGITQAQVSGLETALAAIDAASKERYRTFGIKGTPTINAKTNPIWLRDAHQCDGAHAICMGAPAGGPATLVLRWSSDGTTWTDLVTVSIADGAREVDVPVTTTLPTGAWLQAEYTAVNSVVDMVTILHLKKV